MKRIVCMAVMLLTVFSLSIRANAQVVDESAFDISAQLDAIGAHELVDKLPQSAQELMKDADLYDLSVDKLLQLSPGDFFSTLWRMFLNTVQRPIRIFSSIVAVLILCALLSGMRTAVWDKSMSEVFSLCAVLCVMATVTGPILDCVVKVSQTVQDAAFFMTSFIPMFSAALTAAGQPASGAAYNIFLFAACQGVSQVVSQVLIPFMSVYLAMCVAGSLVPGINISSITGTIKSTVSWILGLLLTFFVGLLSIQTMVAQSADNVATRAAKFMIGSFVPVVGGALSEAYNAAAGCLQLIKTSVGVYGLLAAIFTFLPVLVETLTWYLMTNLAVMAGEIVGIEQVSSVLKACAGMLGILVAVILCFALLIIVSTTVVIATGMGVA